MKCRTDKIAKLTVSSILILLCMAGCRTADDIKSFQAMDTFMTVHSYGRGAAKADQLVQKRIDSLEDHLSTTKEHSDIYLINHSQETEIPVHDETFELLDFAVNMARKTDGALNPALFPVTSAWGFTTGNYTVPETDTISFLLRKTDYNHIELDSERKTVKLEAGMALDLGAVGKGFAGDEAIKVLKKAGIKSAILDLGGNVQALGTKPDGSDWNVGIKNPSGGNPVCGIKVHDKAVITSGGYERFFEADDGKKYIHIFDGKTGRPVENEIASVTVVSDSGLYGDALSTAMFVSGSEKAAAFWKAHRDFEMIIITKDNRLMYTEGLKDSLKVLGQFSKVQVIL